MILIAPVSMIAFLVLGILVAGGDVRWFFDLASLLIVLPLPLLVVVAIGAHGEFTGGLSFAFTGKSGCGRESLLAQARVFMLCHYTTLAAGVLGTIIGGVLMLVNLSDVKSIGPFAAVMMLTLFYGLIIGFFFYYPIAVRLKKEAGRTS